MTGQRRRHKTNCSICICIRSLSDDGLFQQTKKSFISPLPIPLMLDFVHWALTYAYTFDFCVTISSFSLPQPFGACMCCIPFFFRNLMFMKRQKTKMKVELISGAKVFLWRWFTETEENRQSICISNKLHHTYVYI